MTHTKKYPVTTKEVVYPATKQDVVVYPVAKQDVPQPHLTLVARRTEVNICSGWAAFLMAGIIAISVLLCIRYLGGPALFPTPVNLYGNSVPIVKKGHLQVYPFTIDSNYSIQESFFVKFPLIKGQELEYQQVLDNLLKAYPDKYEKPYRNCWLENPTKNEPCFYDRSWITELCTKDNSYGYGINEKGEFNPCFILKFDRTEDWKPMPLSFSPNDVSEHFDDGFIPVICTDQEQRNSTVGVEIYPPKGFSYLYFPVSKFNSSLYLPPLVAVKVKGIQRNREITIKCAILVPNSYVLWNVGRVFITFSSS